MNTHKAFTDQANTWWDPKGPYWTLHALNPLRLDFIHKHIPLSQDTQILDVGCGGGLVSEALAQYCPVLGIDTDQNLIEIAKAKGLAQYLHTDLDHLKPANPFDVITCLEVLEHTKDPKHLIQTMSSYLNPKGKLIVSTLNRNLLSFLGAIVMAEHILKLVPKHTHHYEDLIQPEELIQWCEDSGLVLLDLQGIGYNPLSKTFYTTSFTGIHYMASFEKR